MTAPARGVLCCRIDLLTAFGAQAPVAAPEPGNIDGALEQIGSGELGALSDLCLPGSADLLANTPVHILRVSIDPPDGVFKVRPAEDVFDIAGPLGSIERCSHQSFMVEMRSGDLASKCFRGIVWSRIGDAQQVSPRGEHLQIAIACVVVRVSNWATELVKDISFSGGTGSVSGQKDFQRRPST